MDLESGPSGPFRAFRHRDFRLYVTGQTISLVGTWLESMALSWLVYRLTRSTLLLGTVQFCTLFPSLLLGPVAGIVADRYSRRTVILCMQSLMLIQAAALTALAFSGSLTVNRIVLLAVMLGLCTAFETPARQAIYVRMVGQQDLPNAIALNSMAFNAARVIGPSMGGFMVYAVGEAWCFALNAVSYLAVIVCYLRMRTKEPAGSRYGSAFTHLKDGWRYVWGRRPVRALLRLSAVTNIASAPVLVLAPVFADGIFHMGSRGYGLLTGAFGLGAVGATFRLASRQRIGAMPRTVSLASLAVGISVILLSSAPAYAVCLAAMFLCGFAVMTQLPGTNMLVQSLIAEQYRGRVMALYSMSVLGMIPLGNLAAGALAEVAGARWTAFAGGVICLLSGVNFGRGRGLIEQALADDGKE